MNLLFVRHAKAHEWSLEKWPDDSARPLTDAGAQRFARSVPRIIELMRTCDAVYTSPYARANHTASLLSDISGWHAPIEDDRLAGNRSVDDMLDLARDLDPDGSYAFVGHDPTISLIVSEIIGARPGSISLKTGGVALFSIHGPVGAPDTASLIGLLQPKVLAPK